MASNLLELLLNSKQPASQAVLLTTTLLSRFTVVNGFSSWHLCSLSKNLSLIFLFFKSTFSPVIFHLSHVFILQQTLNSLIRFTTTFKLPDTLLTLDIFLPSLIFSHTHDFLPTAVMVLPLCMICKLKHPSYF